MNLLRRIAHVDTFRGWRATFPRARYVGSGRAVRVGFYVSPVPDAPRHRRYWWRRHPIDTAISAGFGTPFVSVTHYRMVASHLNIRVSPRVSLSVSVLGRWAPRWWHRWSHRRWQRRQRV